MLFTDTRHSPASEHWVTAARKNSCIAERNIGIRGREGRQDHDNNHLPLSHGHHGDMVTAARTTVAFVILVIIMFVLV